MAMAAADCVPTEPGEGKPVIPDTSLETSQTPESPRKSGVRSSLSGTGFVTGLRRALSTSVVHCGRKGKMKRGSTGLLEKGINLMHREAMASTGQLKLEKNIVTVFGTDNLSIDTEISLPSTRNASPNRSSAEIVAPCGSTRRTHKEIMRGPIPEEVIVDSSARSSTAPKLLSQAKGGTASESPHHERRALMTSTWLGAIRGRTVEKEILSVRKTSRGESLDSRKDSTHSLSRHLEEGGKDQHTQIRRGSSLKLPPKSNRISPRKSVVATAASSEPRARVEREGVVSWVVRNEC